MLSQLSRFLQVGAVGFAIDAGVLALLVYQFNWSPILARVVSFLLTIAVTYLLNARYTFNVPLRDASASAYGLVQISGAMLNFVTYSIAVLYGPLAGKPLFSLALGSAIGSTYNFFMMRHYVFAATDRPRSLSRSTD